MTKIENDSTNSVSLSNLIPDNDDTNELILTELVSNIKIDSFEVQNADETLDEVKQTELSDYNHKIPEREIKYKCNKDENQICVTPLKLDESSQNEIESDEEKGIVYRRFACEADLAPVIELITKDLSEPYSIYTYRYFIYNWPKMCLLAWADNLCVGAVVGKVESGTSGKRGYIAMLAVRDGYRRLQIGSRLVELVVKAMLDDGGCREVVLETEVTNSAALALYEKLGFLRDKRLFRYYLNGVDAYRLKLWVS